MNYRIQTLPSFDRQIKKLNKKYPSFKDDFIKIIDKLKKQPDYGTRLRRNCYKIRIPISDKKKGKSGGGRIISLLINHRETIYLLSIYDKSEKSNISDKELDQLLSLIPYDN